jgi:PAS domain S-box-containing protein
MPKRSDRGGEDSLDRIIGVGAHSVRKNYYPELRRRVAELERFRALFDHGNDLFILAHMPDGRILDANVPLCAQLKCTREELIGQGLALVLPPAALKVIAGLSAGEKARMETVLMGADGDQSVVEMTARVAPGAAGPCALLVFRDITEQLRSKVQLAVARERAERANVAKSRFLAAASHDLRQPFQAMTLFQELLAQRLQDPTDKRLIANLAESIRAGQDLLNALLDVSTLDAGIIHPKMGPVRLGALLDGLECEFAAQVAERKMSLRVVGSSLVADSDETLLARMVRNLMMNALKYGAEGGRILVGCRRHGDAVRLMVVDDGPGIPADKYDEIFEEFTQLNNPERDRKKGLGLGLAIVARMARLLGHRVGVESRLGKGAAFFIELSRRDGAPDAAAVA